FGKDIGLNLWTPGKIELARLQHSSCCCCRVTTTLEIHPLKVRLVRLSVMLVDYVNYFVVWREALDHVWTSADRIHHEAVVGTFNLKHVLGIQRTVGVAGERLEPEWIRLPKRHDCCDLIFNGNGFDRIVGTLGGSSVIRILDPLDGELNVFRR